MKSNTNGEAIVTKAQFAAVIMENDSPPPTPPLRNSSLRPLNSINKSYPKILKREFISLPYEADEKRKSLSSSTSRFSPKLDDRGFSCFNFNNSKQNSNCVNENNNQNFGKSPLNDENNLNNNQMVSNCKSIEYNNFNNHTNNDKINSILNNNLGNSNYSFQTNSLTNLNSYDKWKNSPNSTVFDKNSLENNNPNSLFDMNIRHNYLSDFEGDYKNITYNISNNYLSIQNCKPDNWSSTTSVLSTYTGVTSTSDYYTASSEAMTNSPSLSSLNSPSLNSTVCNSPPLSSNTTSAKMYSGVSPSKILSYNKHFSCTAPQISSKIATSSFLPINTSIATSSIVEKPKRQESASVLYYLVAKNSNSSNDLSKGIENSAIKNEVQIQNSAKLNENNYFLDDLSLKKNDFSDKNKYNLNKNASFLNNSTDLKAIQKQAVYQFYLRHKNLDISNTKFCDNKTSFFNKEHFDQINNKNSKVNLTNYSLTSNDSISSSSSTISPSDSERASPATIIPPDSNLICKIDKIFPNQNNFLPDEAIYTNLQPTPLGLHENNSDVNSKLKIPNNSNNVKIKNKIEMIRSSFRNKIGFKKNKENSNDMESAYINELKSINQPNNVKHIAKQFDNLKNNSNCDLSSNKIFLLNSNKNKSKDKVNSPNGFIKLENYVLNESQMNNKNLHENSFINGNAICKKGNNCFQINNYQGNSLEEDLSTEEEFKLKIKRNEESLAKFLKYLHKNEITKIEIEKINLHIEEVEKVTKLFISLICRLNKIESILQIRNQQQEDQNECNLNQVLDNSYNKLSQFKHSSSTDSLLSDANNVFPSMLSLSSISLNNINYGSTLFASVEMLNSKKNKLLDQIEEATQLKQLIERRCLNLNEKIICKYFNFAKFKENDDDYNELKNFDFISCMKDKHNLLIKIRDLENRAMDK